MTMPRTTVPSVRLRACTTRSLRGSEGDYVLYWMTAARRSQHSFALQHAPDIGGDLSHRSALGYARLLLSGGSASGP